MVLGKANAVVAALILAFAWAPASAADLEQRPVAQVAEIFVQNIGNDAVKALRSCSDNGEANQDQSALRELIRRGFNIDLIGRFVLGKYARRASQQQLREYRRSYRDFFVNVSAKKFCLFRGDTFKVVSSQPVGKVDAMVEAQIDRATTHAVKVAWRVRLEEGHYKIIDLVVDGVSLALSQREEFAAIVVNRGSTGSWRSCAKSRRRPPTKPWSYKGARADRRRWLRWADRRARSSRAPDG